nr:three-finger toxin [Rhabdophis subminiatus]
MKTLLLVVVVVGFVYLDLGYTLLCYSCPKLLCLDSVKCLDDQTFCYKSWNNSVLSATNFIRGCAETCPPVNAPEGSLCCATDNCNY